MRIHLAFPFLLAALLACDPRPQAEPQPPPCFAEGAIWGPCRADQTPPEGCDAGLTCLTTPTGGLCVPYGDDGERRCASESQECLEQLGEHTSWIGWCVIFCGEDNACAGGLACDERHKECVWPGPPGMEPPPICHDTTGGMTTGQASTGGTT